MSKRQTLEYLNDMAWELRDAPIFEGDDPIEVNIQMLEDLLV